MKKFLAMLLACAAAASLTAFRSHSTAPTRDDVQTEAVEIGSLTECVSASGHVQPRDAVTVGCDAGGRAVRVLGELGQPVKANDVLVQFDDRLAQLRVQQARVAVELAQAEAQRTEAGRDAAQLTLQRARDTGREADSAEIALRGAEAGLKAAHTRVREAQAALQLAQHGVEMTLVRSPIAGVVIEKRVIAGQQVAPPLAGQLFVVAPEPDRPQVVAQVGEADIGKVRVGQKATFTVNAWPDETFEAKVVRVALTPVTVQGAVHYPVTLDAQNVRDSVTREWRLRCGLPAAVDFAVRRHDGVPRLPATATAVTLDEAKLTDAARRKLSRWQDRGDRADWQRAWVVNTDRQFWPVFLRTGGVGPHGEPGIQDGRYVEVLGFDPEEPSGKSLRVLTTAPAGAKAGPPGLKLF